MIKHYIFTVTNGRSGQATLDQYLKLYATQCLSAFEEPQIITYFPSFLNNFEKKIRRKYFETHELLGRGNVLLAYQEKKLEYLKKIARARLNSIKKKALNTDTTVYFDISKFYIRGLHLGFNALLDNIKLVFLVRDPLLNMKSYINRKKNFFLDNSAPWEKNNMLKLEGNLIKEELYLWSWCETFLRFKSISESKKINKTFIINTFDLDDPKKVKKAFDYLEIKYKSIKKIKKINTNIEQGNIITKVDYNDLKLLKNFIIKIPKEYNELILSIEKSINMHEKNIL